MWAHRFRWMLLVSLLAWIDLVAVRTTWRAATIPHGGIGGGPLNHQWTTHAYVDGRIESVIVNRITGVVLRRTLTREANLEGYIKVWWPVFAGLGFTWLTLWFVLMTDEGQGLFQAVRLPRMSTRGWMFMVAVLGIEGGLIVTTLRDRDIRPERADWVPILLYLAIVHALAFLPVFVVLIHRALAARAR